MGFPTDSNQQFKNKQKKTLTLASHVLVYKSFTVVRIH